MSQPPPARGFIDPNWPNPMGPNDAAVIIYGYIPSFALAIAAAVLFGVSLFLHLYQLRRYCTWYFSTIPIALALEIAGYACRSLSAKVDPYNVIYFVLQYFFIVTAPVFLSAGIYAILSVLINRIGKEYSPLKPKKVLWIFITSDVATTIMQICGAALIGSAQSNRKDPNTGNNILLAGLAIQVFDFFIFLILTGIFLYKARQAVAMKSWGLKGFLVAFVIATLLVYLRTCFRLAETAQGVRSFLFGNEGFFIGLEFVPILLSVMIFNGWHPGRYLKGSDKGREATSGDGNGEREKQNLDP
ncbi:RTA1 like protein-domain-containing protein [Tricladium varicosporioides]|nr:RTA1 like protein-domain-containing protein [Hymenoscyphus varicosporioides]